MQDPEITAFVKKVLDYQLLDESRKASTSNDQFLRGLLDDGSLIGGEDVLGLDDWSSWEDKQPATPKTARVREMLEEPYKPSGLDEAFVRFQLGHNQAQWMRKYGKAELKQEK